MGVGFAPAGVSLGEALAAFAPALGYGVLFVLLLLYRRSLKKVIVGFADTINFALPARVPGPRHPLGGAASWLRHQADVIDSLIGSGMLYCEKATVYLLTQAWNILVWQAREIADLAVATEHALWRVGTSDIPKLLRAQIAPIQARIHGIDRLVGRLEAQAHAQWMRLRHGIDRIERIATRTIPRDIARVGTRVGRVEKTLSGLRGHAGRIEALLGATAIATLVSAALGRLGLNWLKCKPMGRMARTIGCGGFAAAETFLSATFEAMLVLDLCRYALAAQRLARFIVPQLGALLLVQDAVCLGGGASLPSAHDSPRLTTKIALPSAHD